MSAIDDSQFRAMLNACPREALTEWLVAHAAEDGSLRRSLLTLLTPRADRSALVSELNSTISKALSRARSSRDAWKLARPVAAELAAVLETLGRLVDLGDAAAAEKVLGRLVSASGTFFEHIDDSSGYLGSVCREAVALWGRAWVRITPRNPHRVAKLVYDGLISNDYGIQDGMIGDFSEAMGPEGLSALKEMLEAAREANQRWAGLDDWERRAPVRHLADVADAMKDVDAYIRVQEACGMTEIFALSIARRLHDAGRFDEAMSYLNRADPKRPHLHGESDDYTTLKSKILSSLGRATEARETLWQAFCSGLTVAGLERVLDLTPVPDRPARIADAVGVAEKHSNRLAAAIFLVGRGEHGRAANLIEAHAGAFSGRAYEALLRLADTLQENHPEAAWWLYRTLLLDILDSKRYGAYGHAGDYVRKAAALAGRAGMDDAHGALIDDLRQRHGRKTAFWRHVDAPGG
jgi:tetratricopeptide (TPR) repeat protein